MSTHGSPELDEDALKLEAMGADPGPTLDDIFADAENAVLSHARREAKFAPASDEELREAGYDPDWIFSPGDDEEGPFRVYRDNGGVCGHCGGTTPSFMVLNLETAMGGSTEWHGENGEIEAQETAGILNQAWLSGYQSAQGKGQPS